MNQSPPSLLSVADVALELGVSRITVIAWIKSGRLKATKIGRLWKVRREWLNELVEAGEHVPVTEVVVPLHRVVDEALADEYERTRMPRTQIIMKILDDWARTYKEEAKD
jgi:excisionase family DNA binding protein